MPDEGSARDVADFNCQVVLRDAERILDDDRYVLRDGAWMTRVRVDVHRSALMDDSRVALLVRIGADSDDWYELPPDASAPVDERIERVSFTIDASRFGGEPLPGPQAEEQRVEFIPFLAGGGIRYFDHNRIPDVMGAYLLHADDGFRIADDPHVCAAEGGPTWMGHVTATISRAASRPCESGVAFGGRLVFDTWARQRAAVTDLCFEAYEEGRTDVDEPELWRLYDARVHYRFSSEQPYVSEHIPLVGRVGNNAQYAFDLRSLDPFLWGRCPGNMPLTRMSRPGGDMLQAEAQVYFSINQRTLQPGDDEAFRVVYEDYADAPRVTCDP